MLQLYRMGVSQGQNLIISLVGREAPTKLKNLLWGAHTQRFWARRTSLTRRSGPSPGAPSHRMGWADNAKIELENDPQYQKLLKAFRLFDKNNDDVMDASELQALLCRGGGNNDTNQLSVQDCKMLIKDFDDNGDGKLSIAELCAAWTVIGGDDGSLDDAMKTRRVELREKLKEKQAAAARGELVTSKAVKREEEAAEEDDDVDTKGAARRGKEKVVNKTGKDVKTGAGSLTGDKVDPSTLTAEERAKLKVKEELQKKEARKKAAKEAKKKAEAEAAA